MNTMHDPHEHFNTGLIQAERNALQMVDKYHQERDRLHPVPYSPPEPMELQPYRSTSDELTHAIIAVGKPLIALTAVGGTVVGIGAMVLGLVTSGLAFIGANAVPIGGGFVVFVFAVLAVFGARGAGESESSKEPPKGWEFYQEQKQGWRQV